MRVLNQILPLTGEFAKYCKFYAYDNFTGDMHVGEPRFDLHDKYYDCIFNEELQKYDIDTRHTHKIIRAMEVHAPGFIYNGLCLQFFIDGKDRVVWGCREEDVK